MENFVEISGFKGVFLPKIPPKKLKTIEKPNYNNFAFC